MSGWTTIEAHCLNREFSEEKAKKIESRIRKKCDWIVYKSRKRIVGIRSGYNTKPRPSKVHKLSSLDDVAVAIVEANDTSGTGSTELIVDKKVIETYADEDRCRGAARKLQDLYGVYLYANEYWKNISCNVDIDESNGTDGRVSVRQGFNGDVQIDFEQDTDDDRELLVTSKLDEDDAKFFVEQIRDAAGLR